MDQYVPPLVAMTTGVIIVLLCFVVRIPFFIIGLLSLVMVGYALQDHIIRFSSDYKNATSPAFFRNNASLLIISLVIIMSLGFLLLKFGPKTITMNERTTRDRLDRSGAQEPGFFSSLFSGLGNMFGSKQSSRGAQGLRRGNENDGYGNSGYERSGYERSGYGLRSSDIERYT